MAAGVLRPGCLVSSSSSSRGLRRYSCNPRKAQRQFAPRKLRRAPWTICDAASTAGSLGNSSSPDDGDADAAVVGAGFPATVFTLINVIMGAGYVSIPFACRQGGWAALAVLWLLGAVFCYTGNTVLQCCELVDKQRQQQQQQQQQGATQDHQTPPVEAAAAPAGYEDVAGAAFGQFGRLLVSGVMYAELLGICCVYVVLEAEALSTLLASSPVCAWLSGVCGGPAGFIIAASALILPTVLLPSVEALAPLGAIGVLAAVTVGCVLAGLYSGTPAAVTALADTHLVQLATMPQVLGVLAFVYAGHSTFPVIQQSMAQTGLAKRAVTLGYAATAAICTLIGTFGYALWGPATEQVITANLATGSVLALLLTGLTAANPFSAFAVTLEPVALVVQRRLWGKPHNDQQQQQQQQQQTKSGDSDAAAPDSSSSSSSSSDTQPPYLFRAAVRLGLGLACCVTAGLLPYVADLMAFVGALLTMSVSLILPALMHLVLFGQEAGPWLLALDVAVVLLGVCGAFVGASSAAGSLQQKLAAAAC